MSRKRTLVPGLKADLSEVRSESDADLPAISTLASRPYTTPKASMASATFLKPAMLAPRT